MKKSIKNTKKNKSTTLRKTLLVGAAVASLAGGAFIYRSFSESTEQPQTGQRAEISF